MKNDLYKVQYDMHYRELSRVQNIETLKTAYRNAAKALHPDLHHGIDDTYMKHINKLYGSRLAELSHKNEKGTRATRKQYANNVKDAEEFRELINKLIFEDADIIEVCGTWVWITPNERTNAARLKALGFKWCDDKAKFYWHSSGYKGGKHRPYSMDRIRKQFGQTVIVDKSQTA